tara:strand:- start:959 stop:1183 length:225 start_codon:yes stop_codon:yes gene_type:complete
MNDYRYVFTTCNNCGVITSLVDLQNHEEAKWSWYDKTDDVLSYNFNQAICCGTVSNGAVCLHFTNNKDILEVKE